MNGRLMALSLVALSVLPACATRARTPLAARHRAYERLLSFVEPGMTRRQLYALLPPSCTPSAQHPSLSSFIGIAQYSPHTEQHPLDRDFSLRVQYRLARHSDYPPSSFTHSHHHNVSIDDLLFVHANQKSILSRQNPDDELVRRPTLLGGGFRATIYFDHADYNDLFKYPQIGKPAVKPE